MNQEENKAWNDGLDAQNDGVPKDSNPYIKGSPFSFDNLKLTH